MIIKSKCITRIKKAVISDAIDLLAKLGIPTCSKKRASCLFVSCSMKLRMHKHTISNKVPMINYAAAVFFEIFNYSSSYFSKAKQIFATTRVKMKTFSIKLARFIDFKI